MLNEQLKVGDYIFSPNGKLCRIIKVNKCSYTYNDLTTGYADNVKFNGIKHSWCQTFEFFKCDEPQAKALELMIAEYRETYKLKEIKEEIEELLGKAKTFLNQIADIEEVEVE